MYEFINCVEKKNGTNGYRISICHVKHNHEVWIAFDKNPFCELVYEYFQVHYTWKNAKRSMFNLTLRPTKTLAESQKLSEKKIKDLELKIK